MPRVSVVIPTYNRPDFLGQTLRSVFAQTFEDFTVLVRNDGGQDIAGALPELEDPRVDYLRHESNRGQGVVVAEAFGACRSEYIAQLDDDDRWDPDFLQLLVGALDEHPSASLAFSDHWITHPDGSLDVAATEASSAAWGRSGLAAGLHRPAYELTLGGSVSTCAALFRAGALDLDDFSPRLTYAQDLWISYLSTRDGRGVVFEPRRLALARRHEGMGGSAIATERNLRDLTIIYERMLSDRGYAVHARELRRRMAHAWAGLALLSIDDRADARRSARRAIRARATPRGLVALIVSYAPRPIASRIVRAATLAVARWRLARHRALLGSGGRVAERSA